MSSIDGKISCDRCGEYNHERSMVFTFRDSSKQFVCHTCADEFIENDELDSFSFLDDLSDEELAMQPNAPEDETFVVEEEIFFPCDECGTMTAEHMLASVHTEPREKYTVMRKCCPLCYSECFDDPRNILTDYTISYIEVIKHEVKVEAMSRAQAERIVLSGKHAIDRRTRLAQVIGKSITRDGS
jgi:hypothetical protein